MKAAHRRTIAILLLVAGLLISGCGSGKQGPASARTSASTASPTSAATSVPTPLSPVSVAGLKKFTGAGFELWLPKSFVGGDLVNDREVVINKLKMLGPQFKQMADTMEQNQTALALIAYESRVGPGGTLTSVTVGKEQVLSGMSLDDFVGVVEQQLPAAFTVTGQTKVQLASYEAYRLRIRSEVLEKTVEELIFVIKEGNMVYVIAYATAPSEMAKRVPDFEKSVNTFRVTP